MEDKVKRMLEAKQLFSQHYQASITKQKECDKLWKALFTEQAKSCQEEVRRLRRVSDVYLAQLLKLESELGF